tara:strand:- start:1665 stop:2456 length:792 start_codon:yes stop_codon:yes gene_type:complete
MTDIFPILDYSFKWVPSFLLAFSRISAMIFLFPYFGYNAFKPRVRIMFIVMLTTIVLPFTGPFNFPMDMKPLFLFVLLLKEIGIGLFIGLGSIFIFETFTFAGSIAGKQMGLGMAEMMDPTQMIRSSLVGQFWTLTMMIGFFSLDFHHFLIETIVRNFQIIPLGHGHFPSELGEIYIKAGNDLFYVGFQLAAPAIVFMIMLDSAIALMARIMPTLPVFLIVLPIKVGMGLFIISISLEIFQTLAEPLLQKTQYLIHNTINLIS